jgi:hypothetical protein
MMHSAKDFWSGLLYVLFGSTAIIVGRDYNMGTALKMGPAYFPSLLGALLILIGAISLIRSFLIQGTPIGAFALKKVAFVVGSVVVFGAIVRGVGLTIALPVLVIVSARASDRFAWRPTLGIAAALTVFCVFVFLKGLGIPLPLIGNWLGGW